MRSKVALSGFLVIAVVLAGGYFYKTASAVCDAPIAYHIGALDPDFGLSEDEARSAISDAESLWEDTTGRNLFTYDEDADFTINFFYDDRQELTDVEHNLSTELEEKRDLSESVRTQYEELLEQYNTLLERYETETNAYNDRLQEHNASVEEWNDKGGAPKDVYEELEDEQHQLEDDREELNGLADQLNDIAKQINTLGERGNMLVRAYNNVVSAYNNTFSGEREFTQGDYQGHAINIYEYESPEELRLVLAHELGHALSLDHVDNTHSIMYYLMGGQSLDSGLTKEDKTEFEHVCGDGSVTLFSVFR